MNRRHRRAIHRQVQGNYEWLEAWFGLYHYINCSLGLKNFRCFVLFLLHGVYILWSFLLHSVYILWSFLLHRVYILWSYCCTECTSCEATWASCYTECTSCEASCCTVYILWSFLLHRVYILWSFLLHRVYILWSFLLHRVYILWSFFRISTRPISGKMMKNAAPQNTENIWCDLPVFDVTYQYMSLILRLN